MTGPATEADTEPISLLLADDDAAFRAGIRSGLEPEGFVVVAEAMVPFRPGPERGLRGC
jgi:hypothetical protein